MVSEDPFLDYLEHGFDSIMGWPGSKQSVGFLLAFRALFEQFGCAGGAAEIGVYHGRYLIALHNLLGGDRPSLGIDLFDGQDRNIDGSGHGSIQICRDNIGRFASNPGLIDLLGADSLTLKSETVRGVRTPFRPFAMFSVDGGHTPLHVVRDFLLASECTDEAGIIAIDDFFHPDWPGVTEGMCSLLSQRLSPFVPFFLTRKKLFCCSASVHRQYYAHVAERVDVHKSHVEFCGWKVLSANFGGEY